MNFEVAIEEHPTDRTIEREQHRANTTEPTLRGESTDCMLRDGLVIFFAFGGDKILRSPK